MYIKVPTLWGYPKCHDTLNLLPDRNDVLVVPEIENKNFINCDKINVRDASETSNSDGCQT